MGIYKNVKAFALAQVKKESAISYLINFFYRVFTNNIVDAVITIIGTVVIGIMTGLNYYGVFFYLTVILFSTATLLTAWAKKYQQEKISECRILKQALFGINGTLRGWSIELQKCAKSIFNLKEKTVDRVIDCVKPINFQSAAFVVCENLWNNLTKYYENDNIYITVFQKFLTENGNICKMIAYSGTHEPSSYGEEYNIPRFKEDLIGTIEYHTYLFSADKKEISVLVDHDSIKEKFKLHPRSTEREENIEQYIGVPIVPAKSGVTFILQVDTNIQGLFGKDKETMSAFAKTAIYPFAQFLHMVYEQSRTVEQTIIG